MHRITKILSSMDIRLLVVADWLMQNNTYSILPIYLLCLEIPWADYSPLASVLQHKLFGTKLLGL